MKCFRPAVAYSQTVTATNANVASQGMDMIFLQQFFNFAPNLYKSTVGVSFLFNQKAVYLVSIS